MIPLSAGFPNPELFPFSRATFETRDGQTIVLEDEKMIRALQYTGTPGFADLIDWFKKFQVQVVAALLKADNYHYCTLSLRC